MKPIGAAWYVNSEEERSDTYLLLNMIHSMAGRMAQSDINKEWHLHSTASYSDYAKTVWSNGIVKIVAETYKDYEGTPVSHEYYLLEDTEVE